MAIGCAVLLIASIFVISLHIADPPNSKQYTTLYLLNDEGLSSGFPHNVLMGETISVNVGLVNHEGRTVDYTAQVWLVGLNSSGTISEMIYYQGITITLPSIGTSVSDNFEKQSETRIDLVINQTGEYRIWIILHKDLPSTPNLVPGQDYAGTFEEELIEKARNNQLENVYFSVIVTD